MQHGSMAGFASSDTLLESRTNETFAVDDAWPAKYSCQPCNDLKEWNSFENCYINNVLNPAQRIASDDGFNCNETHQVFSSVPGEDPITQRFDSLTSSNPGRVELFPQVAEDVPDFSNTELGVPGIPDVLDKTQVTVEVKIIHQRNSANPIVRVVSMKSDRSKKLTASEMSAIAASIAHEGIENLRQLPRSSRVVWDESSSAELTHLDGDDEQQTGEGCVSTRNFRATVTGSRDSACGTVSGVPKWGACSTGSDTSGVYCHKARSVLPAMQHITRNRLVDRNGHLPRTCSEVVGGTHGYSATCGHSMRWNVSHSQLEDIPQSHHTMQRQEHYQCACCSTNLHRARSMPAMGAGYHNHNHMTMAQQYYNNGWGSMPCYPHQRGFMPTWPNHMAFQHPDSMPHGTWGNHFLADPSMQRDPCTMQGFAPPPATDPYFCTDQDLACDDQQFSMQHPFEAVITCGEPQGMARPHQGCAQQDGNDHSQLSFSLPILDGDDAGDEDQVQQPYQAQQPTDGNDQPQATCTPAAVDDIPLECTAACTAAPIVTGTSAVASQAVPRAGQRDMQLPSSCLSLAPADSVAQPTAHDSDVVMHCSIPTSPHQCIAAPEGTGGSGVHGVHCSLPTSPHQCITGAPEGTGGSGVQGVVSGASGSVLDSAAAGEGQDGERGCGKKYRKRSKADISHITMALLQEGGYFNKPIATAASELDISVTMLKHICRQQGVLRWPFRKRSSLDKLLDKTKVFTQHATDVTQGSQSEDVETHNQVSGALT